MAIFKCKMCGGTIEFNEGDTIGVCDSCGTKQTLPRLDSDRKTNLYDRANHFRRNNEFDKAMSIYENILNEDPTDAEAYWSLVLCRYGIEYVEDPATHRRVPTVNRAQFTSIFDDEDYKSAMQNADALQRAIYEDEAKAINEIQKGILEISSKEEPFDVFICYKETDANGRRTPDSVLATDLYHQLTNEGFKVFFSRITLEDKLGQEYEPYIFAALNSAKAMVVLGTKPEHFNAVWVKNEWSRYLALIKAGAKKTLIPAYRDMDPYDLPEEFSHLQAQDMSKLGFMQDLIRGIKKLVKTDEPKQTIRETIVTPAPTAATAPLLRRAFMFLEDGEWQSADEYCEKVLDIEPENAEAYLGKLMAELRVKNRDDLKNQQQPFEDRNNYKKAVRFGDEKLKAELSDDIAFIKDRNETARKTGIYNDGVKAMNAASTESEYKKAAAIFKTIPGFRDADALAERCLEQAEICRKNAIYQSARSKMRGRSISDYESAIQSFRTIPGWKDADEQIFACQRRIEEIKEQQKKDKEEAERRVAEEAKRQAEERVAKEIAKEKAAKKRKKIAAIVIPIIVACIAFVIVLTTVIIPNQKYAAAVELYNAGKYKDAIAAFTALDGYKDSAAQIEKCETAIKDEHYADAMELYAAGKYEEAMTSFNALHGYQDSAAMIVSCETEIQTPKYNAAISLYDNGKYEEAIAAFQALNGWKDSIAQIEKCKTAIRNDEYENAVALFIDGKYAEAITTFQKLIDYKESNTYVQKCQRFLKGSNVATGFSHTVAIKENGTVVAIGSNEQGQCNVSNWSDIVSVVAGGWHTVGLRLDGTVAAAGYNKDGRSDVSAWTDIIMIAAGEYHTVGLKADGTVVASKYTETNTNIDHGQCNVDKWANIVAVAAGGWHTVGLKTDGTVIAVGYNEYGQCNINDWKDVVAIAAGGWHTVGLKTDGTVVAVGSNDGNRCNVSEWKDIVAIAAGRQHTVGLKADGTVVAVGDNSAGECEVSSWSSIVAIAAWNKLTIGLRSDGTVVAVGNNEDGQCDVSGWKNIRLPEQK